MSISDKTRKILWGRSGNKCAICKNDLVVKRTNLDSESIIGEECHIVAKCKNGPRYDSNFPSDKIDSYDNLILLCNIHHKIIDDQNETYTVRVLRKTKLEHELWIKNTLSIKYKNENNNSKMNYLGRITTGRELINILYGAHAFDFDYDDVASEIEVDLVSSFLQNAHDLGDILSDIESGERVKIGYELNNSIQELEESGFWVFGASTQRKIKTNDQIDSWNIAILRILRDNNPNIFKVDLSKSNDYRK